MTGLYAFLALCALNALLTFLRWRATRPKIARSNSAAGGHSHYLSGTDDSDAHRGMGASGRDRAASGCTAARSGRRFGVRS
jgi:hypothetical protein